VVSVVKLVDARARCACDDCASVQCSSECCEDCTLLLIFQNKIKKLRPLVS